MSFILTLVLAAAGVKADSVYKTFNDVTIDRLNHEKKLHTAHKNLNCYQWFKNIDARDNISNATRAVQGSVNNFEYVNIPIGQSVKYVRGGTMYGGYDYSYYMRAKKTTLSTISYWGFWYWDIPNYNG